VPRGRLRFNALSPPGKHWLEDPEDHVRQVIKDHRGEYVEGSLDFTLDGKVAQCLFNSYEPSGDDPGTDFYGFALELHGIDVTLFLSYAAWRKQFGSGGGAPADRSRVSDLPPQRT